MSNNQQSSKMKNEPPIDELQQTFIRKAQMMQQQKLGKVNAIRMRNRLSGAFMAAVVGSICKHDLFW